MPPDYQAPALTLECVLFQIIDGQLTVLIGKVASEMYRGQWALPGSYCAKGETTWIALDRIMRQKAGIEIHELPYVEQLHTFDTIAQDGRRRRRFYSLWV
jgi:8-oxo-dGTP diphosphatase